MGEEWSKARAKRPMGSSKVIRILGAKCFDLLSMAKGAYIFIQYLSRLWSFTLPGTGLMDVGEMRPAFGGNQRMCYNYSYIYSLKRGVEPVGRSRADRDG